MELFHILIGEHGIVEGGARCRLDINQWYGGYCPYKYRPIQDKKGVPESMPIAAVQTVSPMGNPIQGSRERAFQSTAIDIEPLLTCLNTN
jgi:hypothetical protein